MHVIDECLVDFSCACSSFGCFGFNCRGSGRGTLRLLRFGLLSLIAMVLAVNLFQAIPQSVSLSAWYFPATAAPVLVILALAAAAFSVSLGEQPWFGSHEA